ncbi:uncharacterized protein EDB91DRAFT_75817 [Suillus paluster]|uniref:uncharacterized protein n=1 Tax=Suillus paluster TaxID=48578 RepID=UPI001B85F252|nr:uncharacterized protein EDB91DRAFT_75817 [Suillus paluster]KAG1747235.1 hypothetical protein EDB91DRAFT_75817 [Suillus paluster]
MHRALLISEVLLDIFTHFNQIASSSAELSPTSLKSLEALATCARTCKTFHEPATDWLWANMDGIEPLLGCVPRLHQMIYVGDANASADSLCGILMLISFRPLSHKPPKPTVVALYSRASLLFPRHQTVI